MEAVDELERRRECARGVARPVGPVPRRIGRLLTVAGGRQPSRGAGAGRFRTGDLDVIDRNFTRAKRPVGAAHLAERRGGAGDETAQLVRGAERPRREHVVGETAAGGPRRVEVADRAGLLRIGPHERQDAQGARDAFPDPSEDPLAQGQADAAEALIVRVPSRAPSHEGIGDRTEVALEGREHVVRRPVVGHALPDQRTAVAERGASERACRRAIRLGPPAGRPVERGRDREEDRTLLGPEEIVPLGVFHGLRALRAAHRDAIPDGALHGDPLRGFSRRVDEDHEVADRRLHVAARYVERDLLGEIVLQRRDQHVPAQGMAEHDHPAQSRSRKGVRGGQRRVDPEPALDRAQGREGGRGHRLAHRLAIEQRRQRGEGRDPFARLPELALRPGLVGPGSAPADIDRRQRRLAVGLAGETIVEEAGDVRGVMAEIAHVGIPDLRVMAPAVDEGDHVVRPLRVEPVEDRLQLAAAAADLPDRASRLVLAVVAAPVARFAQDVGLAVLLQLDEGEIVGQASGRLARGDRPGERVALDGAGEAPARLGAAEIDRGPFVVSDRTGWRADGAAQNVPASLRVPHADPGPWIEGAIGDVARGGEEDVSGDEQHSRGAEAAGETVGDPGADPPWP